MASARTILAEPEIANKNMCFPIMQQHYSIILPVFAYKLFQNLVKFMKI